MKRNFFCGAAIAAAAAVMTALSAAEPAKLPEIAPVKAWRGETAAQEKIFTPVLGENTIRFGSKTLFLTPEGKINCTTPDHGVLFNSGVYFMLRDNGVDRWNWQAQNFDREKSKFSRSGSKYTWELWYKGKDGNSFPGISQTLEVLPDGLLSITYRYTLPEKKNALEYRPWCWTISMPGKVWSGQTVRLGDKQEKLGPEFKSGSFKTGKLNEWIFGAQDPSKKFALIARQTEAGKLVVNCRKGKDFQIHFGGVAFLKNDPKFCLDLRRGVDGAGKDIRGGVDLKALENLTLPDNSHKNLVENPSFERGFEGWHFIPLWFTANENRDWKPFAIDDKIAFDGKSSLRMNVRSWRPWMHGNPQLSPIQIVADPGVYTLSFYARGAAGRKSRVYAWIPNYHNGKVTKAIDNDKAKWGFDLTDKWQRFEGTFEVKQGEPLLFIGFHGRDAAGEGTVWLDAVQLEKGKKATAYEPPPAEGRLLTSDPDNFISSKEKIGGRLRITTAKPEASGTVRVTVKNFFDEIILDKTEKFRTGSDRTAEFALPLDDLPGLGIFLVKGEYKLDDGSKAYDFRRYSRVEFQVDSPDRFLYGLDYSNVSRRCDFLKELDRWQKLGVGAKQHIGTKEEDVFEAMKKYGLDPLSSSMLSYMREGAGPLVKHFFIVDSKKKIWRVVDDPKQPSRPEWGLYNVKDPAVLIGDFHWEAGGKITPEYLAKLKNACKTVAAHNRHIKLWALGGELTCKMPNDWWGKGFTDRDVAHSVALLLKAFTEGVREGNPEAKVYQDDPANMSPARGIAETDLLLEECNKLGVRFDVIAIHTYRYSPENPDMDADTAKFLSILKKRGYGNTPVIWPEGMHWGPYEIPQWRLQSSTWWTAPVTWRGGLLSYDFGWTEKKSAAWYARSWLVMLKYSSQVKGATSGCINNNCYMDAMLTPFAAQLIPNTLVSVFHQVKFKKDIRFAPFIRTYVFEDISKRPVAAVWCHQDKMDDGSADSIVAMADFGDSLEGVTDLMNSPRAVHPGKMKFPVSSFPVFFRGKPGTLKQMIAAFENAEVISGSSIPLLAVSVNPQDSRTMKITIENTVSREFRGTFNGQALKVPPAGQKVLTVPLKTPLKYNALTREEVAVKVRSEAGSEYGKVFDLEAFMIKRVPDQATVDTLDWGSLPQIAFERSTDAKNPAKGKFRMGWNRLGLFIETEVKDAKFVHVEYPKPDDRWKNDCLQIYFDTFANARKRPRPGYDEDDYDYAVFPNSKGDSAQVYRYRTVESQLGLATQAPRDKTFAPDIPCRFSRKNGRLIYRVFFPAKYLLPMKLEKGWVFGCGLYAGNSDKPGKYSGALTLAIDGKGCYNRPHAWPAVILSE